MLRFRIRVVEFFSTLPFSFTELGKKCCKDNGVPDDCLGLCRNPEMSASRNIPVQSSEPNACSEYQKMIAECGFGPKQGN